MPVPEQQGRGPVSEGRLQILNPREPDKGWNKSPMDGQGMSKATEARYSAPCEREFTEGVSLRLTSATSPESTRGNSRKWAMRQSELEEKHPEAGTALKRAHWSRSEASGLGVDSTSFLENSWESPQISNHSRKKQHRCNLWGELTYSEKARSKTERSSESQIRLWFRSEYARPDFSSLRNIQEHTTTAWSSLGPGRVSWSSIWTRAPP